jgi:hypothetical protein
MSIARRIISSSLLTVATCGVLLCGCTDFLTNRTASLGGTVAGTRGTVTVLFINNTPHRAVFTYGTYDQTDPSFTPDFAQFTLEGLSVLDADETSTLAETNDDATLACARVFSIGSPDLFELIRDNVSDDVLDDLDDAAMHEGVEFFDMPAEDDEADEEAEPQSRGFAPPFEALLGTDFPCNSLLILRFEIDDANPDAAFRVDFEMIPSESDR